MIFKNISLAVLFVGLVLQASLPAAADQYGPGISGRFARQQTRINQGIANGQLTRREYNSDESRLQHIEAVTRHDRRANGGGRLTVAERKNINARLNGNSRQIYFTKHNLQHQPGARTL